MAKNKKYSKGGKLPKYQNGGDPPVKIDVVDNLPTINIPIGSPLNPLTKPSTDYAYRENDRYMFGQQPDAYESPYKEYQQQLFRQYQSDPSFMYDINKQGFNTYADLSNLNKGSLKGQYVPDEQGFTFEPQYSLPEFTVQGEIAKPKYKDAKGGNWKNWDKLTPEEKSKIKTGKFKNKYEMHLIENKATYDPGEWIKDFKNIPSEFVKSMPGTAANMVGNTFSIPMALMTEGLEHASGKPYNYSNAFDVMGDSQRTLSDVVPGINPTTEMILDAGNYIPFGLAAKAGSKATKAGLKYLDNVATNYSDLAKLKNFSKEFGYTPNKLGSGSYGDVYSLNSNQALKKWHTPEQLPTNVDDIIEKHRQLPSDLQSRTIIPKKGAFSKADRVEIMPKVEGAKDMKPLNQATPAEMEQVLKEVDELNKSGIYVDISNPENILINPKTGKATYLDLNTSQNIISGKRYPKELEMLLTQREIPRQLPGSPNAFKSEIDWAKWNKEIPQNKALMDEYLAIEQKAKADGTWMKNPDGTPSLMPEGSKPTPELWIQSQSKNWEKAYGHKGFGNIDNTYRGVGISNTNPDFSVSRSPNLSGDRGIFTGNYDLARNYAFGVKNPKILTPFSSREEPGVFHLIHPKGKQIDYNTMLSDWTDVNLVKGKSKLNLETNLAATKSHYNKLKNIPDVNPELLKAQEKRILELENYINNFDNIITDKVEFDKMRAALGDITSTDDIAEYIASTNLNKIKLRNIIDGDLGDVTIVNNKPGNYLKSAVGNNGMFDMSNPNIYKSLVPIMGVGAAGTYGANQLMNQQQQMKKLGGRIKLQRGGRPTDPGKEGMMKARLAYAEMHGNPAAKRMVAPTDSPYDFGDGNTGTHYMASIDNYAVPQIQDNKGSLMLNNYGPLSNEAMKFDSPEDANYFAENYKTIAPAFRAMGGFTQPQYEAEKGEVVDGGMPVAFNGGSITPNSMTSGKINGQTHEQGGVDMAGGKRVFSDRLKVDSNFLKDLDI